MSDSITRAEHTQAKQSFLTAIDQLIPMIEEAQPGHELRDVGPLAEILAGAARILGYPRPPINWLWYCYLDSRVHVESVDFDSPWESGRCSERVIRIYKVDGDTLVPTMNVPPVNSQERSELLSLLRQWRRAVSAPASSAAGSENAATRNPVQWAGKNRRSSAIVFTDIVDSTGQKKKIGDTRWGEIIGKHFSCARELITRHGGCLVKTIGDAVLAIFHTAGEALDFSLAIVRDTGDPLIRLRAGIGVGEVNLFSDDVQGLSVDSAKRIQTEANPMQIVVSDRAHGDILQTARNGHRELPWQDEGERELKGIGMERLWSISVRDAIP